MRNDKKNKGHAVRISLIAAAMAMGLSGCVTTDLTRQTQNATGGAFEDFRREATSQASALESARRAAAIAAPAARFEMPRPSGRTTDPRFNVDARDLPAGQAIAHILGGSGMTAVLTEEAEAARVSITLRDVNWREALDALRDARGFDYRVDGRRVLVDKSDVISRTFEIGYLAGTRTGSGGFSGSSGGSSGGGSSGSTVNSASTEDFWGALKETLDAIVGSSGKITINSATGTVYARGSARAVREVGEYIKAQEKSAHRQVLFEMKIVEVALDDNFQAGVNWSLFNKRGNAAGGVLPGGGNVNPGATTMSSGPISFGQAAGTLLAGGAGSPIGLALQTANFGMVLSFLDSQGSTHILSSPRVATLNNRKAVLRVGDEQQFATGASSSTTAAAGSSGTVTTPTVSTQSFFSGVVFDVTPNIGSDGMVTVHVRPQLTNVQQKILNVDLGTAGSVSMPTAQSSVRDADTIIRIKPGTTAAIGGLFGFQSSSSKSGVPGISCVMGDCRSGGKKTELVLLIQAHLVENESDWARGSADFR
jgi:MSHA biogenesis protein MshL